MRAFRTFALQVLVFAVAAGAHAQATRTWVSGVGDDVNPCSRTAPCKTWAGAISKTATGGEINALDPGGVGALTITKSITIDGNAQHASTLHSGVNGFNINDSASATPNTAKVVLRNLAINGAGTTIGLNGIRFTSGKELTVENVFMETDSNRGIDIQTASAASPLVLVNIINTTIQNTTSGGIVINATGAGGPVKMSIFNSRVLRCASGLFAGQGSEVSISNSLMSHNTQVGIDTGGNAVVNVDNSTIMNNAIGVQATGSPTIRLSRNMIVQNATSGFRVNGGQIQSYLDNYFSGNGPNVGSLTNISANKQ